MSRFKLELETYADEVWDRFEKLKKFEEYDKIKAENDNLTRANQELNIANETLRRENGRVTRQFEDAERDREGLGNEVSKLQSNLRQALAKRDEFETEINQVNAKFEDLEKELRRTRNHLKTLRTSQAFTRFIVDPDQLSKEDLRSLLEIIKRDLLSPLEHGYRGRLTEELVAEGVRRAAGATKKVVEYLVRAGAAHPNYACPQCRSTPSFDGEGALICTKCDLKWFITCPRCGSKMNYVAQDAALHCPSCTLTWR